MKTATWAGTETEYALIFHPDDASRKPANRILFECLNQAINEEILVIRGSRMLTGEPRFFMENGGCYYFEIPPNSVKGGLIEFATPECESPIQLLHYKFAQRCLLKKVRRKAQQILASQGYIGRLAILKNSRDAYDNYYGEQENYLIESQSFKTHLIYLATALLLFIPSFVVTLSINIIACLVLLLIAVYLITAIGFKGIRGTKTSDNEIDQFVDRHSGWITALIIATQNHFIAYLLTPLSWASNLNFINRYRNLLCAHLCTRIIYTGCGTVSNERFYLSEKPLRINSVIRILLSDKAHPVFETHNFHKNYYRTMLLFSKDAYKQFCSKKQRLQIGLSDSNMAPVGEYLKLGTTFLLIEMHKAGFKYDVPQLLRPLDALKRINKDISLNAAIETDQGTLTALEIQHRYLNCAKQFIKEQSVSPQEWIDIVQLWEKTLVSLGRNPGELFGQIDWIIKYHLIQQLGCPLSDAAVKKIDLKYHELETGYFSELEKKDLTSSLLNPSACESAITEPPNTRASIRSKYMHDLIKKPGKVKVNWSTVTYKKSFLSKAQVFSLDDYRK